MKIVEASTEAIIDAIAYDTAGFQNYIRELKPKIARGDIVFYGAELNGSYVGRVCLQYSPVDETSVNTMMAGAPSVQALQINSDHRRMGIASFLLRAVYDRARIDGFTQIFIGVEPTNFSARGLYEKQGFEYVGMEYESCWDEPTELGKVEQKCVQVLLMVRSL